MLVWISLLIRDVLIVEDDTHKREELELFISKHTPNVTISNAASVTAAISAIDLQIFSLVLLDMALPSHPLKPGMGPPVSLLSGGLELILEFDYSRRKDPIVVLTQHPEIEVDGELLPIKSVTKRLRELYAVNLIDCLYYELGSDVWQERLREIVDEI